MRRLDYILRHPPRNTRGDEPSAVILVDRIALHFYYWRTFRDADAYKQIMAEEGIQWRKSFTVYERLGTSWHPACGSVRH